MDVLKPYLTIGINIAVSAFHHLDDTKVKMYIVYFNMFTIYLDDACPNDPDARDGIPNFTQVSHDGDAESLCMLILSHSISCPRRSSQARS